MLLPFDVADEFLNVSNLWIEHLLKELRSEFLTDGEFIGSFDSLVEVSTKPGEFLLVLSIEGGHLVQSLDAALCGGVIELLHGIANHCADGLVTGSLTSEEGFLVGLQVKLQSLVLVLCI